MTVRIDGRVIHLEADCRVEEAETLVALLEADPGSTVDVSECRSLHAATLQVLMHYRPEIAGQPADEFLREQVLPNLSLGMLPRKE